MKEGKLFMLMAGVVALIAAFSLFSIKEGSQGADQQVYDPAPSQVAYSAQEEAALSWLNTYYNTATPVKEYAEKLISSSAAPISEEIKDLFLISGDSLDANGLVLEAYNKMGKGKDSEVKVYSIHSTATEKGYDVNMGLEGSYDGASFKYVVRLKVLQAGDGTWKVYDISREV